MDADDLSVKYVPFKHFLEVIRMIDIFLYLQLQPFLRSKTPHTNFKEDAFEVKVLTNNSTDNVKGKSKDSLKEKDSQKDREKICWLCEFKFTLFKRQHHCRLCDCVCCDDCSKKKALVDEVQVGDTL